MDKGRHRDAGTLVVCCTEAVGLLGRDTEENRYVVISRRAERLFFQISSGKVQSENRPDVSTSIFFRMIAQSTLAATMLIAVMFFTTWLKKKVKMQL
ncbi:hypothetical protein Y032_0183g911 [Ancylostoma ceylanicum]|uniref:Uncharacterized protein n=1 Tax=Ancylostoma ceylanicum TaxID=53326 RepID=A0A016SRX0_9BILA|nr:hypothetical protein Y032_0183g911 [Ancylostoma ceylanicum]